MWSSIAIVCAIAVASNLDNAGVGIAYGVRRVTISSLANALIALISGVATYVAGVAGSLLVRYMPSGVTAYLGGGVVVLVGVWILTEPLRTMRRQARNNTILTRILRDPMVADFDQSKHISLGEAAILGVALALNALAGGFDAGVVHIPVWLTALLVAVFSYILLGVSAYLGRRFAAERLGSKATVIAGILLLLIGIHQIL
ncbi:manganese efflux pump [Alicyclobacillus mengziensis]|uniref:Manganese efflux pump n=1 Tax=Alicyclobacillus mengziensis TaxID=2931921 RepID=A0A9X7W0G2_9BACL|nr:manganese efflux pump [Alicyclobacillus mengziensis]QSO47907.1 manganese efflux pump [Alicyclobacillus mengziensis]